MIAEREVRTHRCCRVLSSRAQVPQEPPRGTDSAMRCPKGDGFRLVSVSLACSRGIPMGGAAARLPEGDASCRETARGRQDPPASFSFGRFRDKPSGQLPRELPRGTDSAAERPEGDGFRPISVSLARSRGTRRSAGVARPPSTQKAHLERRASNTKLCSRTRAYRLSASTGQEEMQAPHSMHSSSLTSA